MDQNLQTGGIADVLNSLGQGYLQGQQTLISRRAAAANLLRQQALLNLQQQKDLESQRHNSAQESYWDGIIKDRDARTGNQGDNELSTRLNSLDFQMGKGLLTPDAYYRARAVTLRTFGKNPSDPSFAIPSQYYDTPPTGADGNPVAPAPIDPNPLLGPTTLANNKKTTSAAGLSDARASSLGVKTVEGLLKNASLRPDAASQAQYLQGVYAGDPTAPQIPIPGVTPIGQQQDAIAGPVSRAQMLAGLRGLPLTSDPSTIGQSTVPPISPVLAGAYTPDIKTAADVSRLGSVTKVNEARLPILATIPDLNRARIKLDTNLAALAAPGGPRAKLMGAQAQSATSNALLHDLVRQYLPQMDEAKINSMNVGPVLRALGVDSTISAKKQANLKELSKLGFILNSPRDPKTHAVTITTGKDANGNPITQTYTPEQLRGFADEQLSLQQGNAQIDKQLNAIRGMGGLAAGQAPSVGTQSDHKPVPGAPGLTVDSNGVFYKNGVAVRRAK